jgi:hypothetical protein
MPTGNLRRGSLDSVGIGHFSPKTKERRRGEGSGTCETMNLSWQTSVDIYGSDW